MLYKGLVTGTCTGFMRGWLLELVHGFMRGWLLELVQAL